MCSNDEFSALASAKLMMSPQLENNMSDEKGPIADRTVLRFAHAFESGGGTERYLDDLDFTLLRRNEMTIVRLHLTRNPPNENPIEERIGKGRLLRVPLQIIPTNGVAAEANGHVSAPRLKQIIRDRLIYHPLVWNTVGSRWAASLSLPPRPGQAIGAGAAAAEILRARHVDLVVLHFFGGADADEVLEAARQSGTPVAILNHYSNDRFLHLAIRKHAMLADGIAGVNGLDLPAYLRGRFSNLSDGIDTEFFRSAHARPLADRPPHPVILLPARVTREKGQMDLIRAASSLRRSGIECCVAFAGRVDASGFAEELRQEIAREGMSERVRFLGELSVEDLRDWYAASTVVAFPTYHHEGLGRVIVEAQAMEKPVVAYATGGVPEGIVSGKTGYLVPTGDVAGLTARLRELLTSLSLCGLLGISGREMSENRFSLTALADRHERFYSQVLTVRQASGREKRDR